MGLKNHEKIVGSEGFHGFGIDIYPGLCILFSGVIIPSSSAAAARSGLITDPVG